jgi:hypothetical protein
MKFIKNNIESLIPLAILLFLAVGMLKVEISKKESLKKIEKEKQTMSEEELILFEASKARCTNRRSGSRPSCWKKRDWDVFFLEYCKRVSCQK